MAAAKTTAAPATEELPEVAIASEAVDPELTVIQRISRVQAEAGPLAPKKSGGVPFPFRGIDGTVNHLAPLLAKYGLVVVPSVIDRTVDRRPIGNKTLTATDVHTSFRVYGPDGKFIEGSTIGLAEDYADRSTAQAESVALRVFLLQTFFLPTQSPEPEQTGEEAQKETAAQRKIASAGKGATKPPAKAAAKDAGAPPIGGGEADVKLSELRKLISDNLVSRDDANAIRNGLAESLGKPKGDLAVLNATIEKIHANIDAKTNTNTGEVA